MRRVYLYLYSTYLFLTTLFMLISENLMSTHEVFTVSIALPTICLNMIVAFHFVYKKSAVALRLVRVSLILTLINLLYAVYCYSYADPIEQEILIIFLPLFILTALFLAIFFLPSVGNRFIDLLSSETPSRSIVLIPIFVILILVGAITVFEGYLASPISYLTMILGIFTALSAVYLLFRNNISRIIAIVLGVINLGYQLYAVSDVVYRMEKAESNWAQVEMTENLNGHVLVILIIGIITAYLFTSKAKACFNARHSIFFDA
jgi:hypothetical protein